MAIIQGNTKVAAAGGYQIENAIRFDRSTASQYLNRSQVAGEPKKVSVSFWMKRCGGNMTATNDIYGNLVAAGVNNWTSTAMTYFPYLNNNKLSFYSATPYKDTSQVFRDQAAWCHVLVAFDSTLATAANRFRMYINGVEVTDFSTNNNPGLNMVTGFNNVSYSISVGGTGAGNGAQWFDGYMAQLIIVDNQQLTPSDVGEFSDEGVWRPIEYTGSVGTNGGIYLFDNASNLGEDSSANGLDFTVYGSPAQTTDTPTNNKIVWNGLQNQRVASAASGTKYNYTGSTRTLCGTTIHIPPTGKWVAAFSASNAGVSNYQLGLLSSYDTNFGDAVGSNEDVRVGFGPYTGSTYLAKAAGPISWFTGVSADANDTLWIAVDADNDEQWAGIYDDSASAMVWFGYNGTTGDIATRTNPTDSGYIAAVGGSVQFCACARNSAALTILDIENAPGYASIPADYKSLSTANLPTPAIADGSAYFQATTYTGAGYPTEVNQSGNSTFQPDFVWVKRRNAAVRHVLIDAVRGGSSILESSNSRAENIVSGALTFDSDGFTAAADPIYGDLGTSGNTFVGWQWLAANGTASNEDGSITSTVSANTTAGFSVVTYTGTGSAATIGHGLSTAPSCIFAKARTSAYNWKVYHSGLTSAGYRLILDSTAAQAADSTTWNNTDPTSSVFSVGTDNGTNASSVDYVAYCFAEVEGFSKAGQYTGNGSADGSYVHLGFTPSFLIIKCSSVANSWTMYDTARQTYNPNGRYILAESTAAEVASTTVEIDILSNGFKARDNQNNINGAGRSYIYLAWAEHPAGGAGVAPATAR